ncbi:MAG TPA: hypothetical protein PK235_14810 [Phycisphaerae bacterium]|nr:hypothetical protein [Phycisphaerae bacterium]
MNTGLVPQTAAIDCPGLSGLKKLTVVTIAMSGGNNPFQGLSMPEALALAGVLNIDVTLSEGDAGQQKVIDIPVVNLGGAQAFAAACAD